MQTSLPYNDLSLPGIGIVRYAMEGEGMPVVLLHGLGASSITWKPNIPALASEYSVYAPDLPGHGGSSTPRARYDLDLGVRFVNAFLDARHIDSAALVGNSLGGLIAVATALRTPERVRALVLVSSAGLSRTISWPLRLASLPLPRTLLMSLVGIVGGGLLKRIFYDPQRVDPVVVDELLRQTNHQPTADLVLRSIREGVTLLGLRRHLMLWEEIPRVQCPVAAVWGKQDRIIPVHHGYRLAQRFPHVQLRVFDQCGHLPQLEHPDRFNRVARDFLKHVGVNNSGPGAA